MKLQIKIIAYWMVCNTDVLSVPVLTYVLNRPLLDLLCEISNKETRFSDYLL